MGVVRKLILLIDLLVQQVSTLNNTNLPKGFWCQETFHSFRKIFWISSSLLYKFAVDLGDYITSIWIYQSTLIFLMNQPS
jgi:hypothetical protein